MPSSILKPTWMCRSTTTIHTSTPIRPPSNSHIRRFQATKSLKPLRILFCGSDHFSCASLQALHDEHIRNPSLIASIDVLVRPGKKTGRGLKRIAVGPLYELAEKLRLPLHQRDTFTGWDLPPPGLVRSHLDDTIIKDGNWLPRIKETGEIVPNSWTKPLDELRKGIVRPINLIIAVSFGLFVPPRVLRSAKYGGLNVHPSLLPDLRGPAPLQHTLLAKRTNTGVSLQTLHEKAFDRGNILVQTPLPGIPVPDLCTTQQLHNLLAPLGAEMLVQALRDGLHVRALDDVKWQPAREEAEGRLRDAPKITKLDSKVDWDCSQWGSDTQLYPRGWTATDLVRRIRVLGKLWTHGITERNPQELRVIWEDVEAVRCPGNLRSILHLVLQNQFGWDAIDPLSRQGMEADASFSHASTGNITWTTKNHESHYSKLFRLPFVAHPDGESTVIPIRVPYKVEDGHVIMLDEEEELDALRIKFVTVEGQKARPPAQALAPLAAKNISLQDLLSLEYAVNVMARRVDTTGAEAYDQMVKYFVNRPSSA